MTANFQYSTSSSCYDRAARVLHFSAFIRGGYRGGAWGAQAPPPSAKTTYRFQWTLGWTTSFSTPLQPRNLDLTYIWLQNLAKNLFVEWKSRVPLTSLAVCLVRSNYVGVAKKFRVRLFILAPPPSWGPGSAPDIAGNFGEVFSLVIWWTG